MLKARVQSNEDGVEEYKEEQWLSTAQYAQQTAETFINRTNLNGDNNVGAGIANSPVPKGNSSSSSKSANGNINGNGNSNSNNTGGSSKKVGKPVEWVPDNSVPNCMECKANFTMFFRRHHCRRCGRMVCVHCAPNDNSRPIPEWGLSDPVRHCKACYRSPIVKWNGEK